MDTVKIYEAADGWRWNRKAANGELISESGEAYTRKADAEEAALRVNEALALVNIDEK